MEEEKEKIGERGKERMKEITCLLNRSDRKGKG